MFYDNLKELCSRKQITISYMAKELGFSNSIPTYWKRGAIPKADTLQKIADYFGITTDELLSQNLSTSSHLHHEKGVKIGVLSSVGAGIPLEAISIFDQDDPDAWEEISRADANAAQYFALRIRGDSMEPEIRHGDIVIVRRSEEFEDGDWVIALVNGDEGVCKVLRFRDNGISLNSLNPEYDPMIFTKEQIEDLPVRLIGVVEEIRRKRIRR